MTIRPKTKAEEVENCLDNIAGAAEETSDQIRFNYDDIHGIVQDLEEDIKTKDHEIGTLRVRVDDAEDRDGMLRALRHIVTFANAEIRKLSDDDPSDDDSDLGNYVLNSDEAGRVADSEKHPPSGFKS